MKFVLQLLRWVSAEMNVLSLFDGMSCGQIALKRAGISFGKYFASEVDKHVITVTQANHPDTVQLGDVTLWREWDIDWSSIGLIMGGSPCQGFSFAGKGLAFDDPRSKLFFVFVDIINHVKSVNPNVKFLLENVRMKKEHLSLITRFMGVEPVFINSALVSAQNRQRFYWTNWNFGQPVDRGLVLADVIEDDPENVVQMSERFVERQKGRKCLVNDLFKKASSLSAMEYVKNGRQGDYVNCDEKGKPLIFQRARGTNKGGIRAFDGKVPTLTSSRWEQNNFISNIPVNREKSKTPRVGGFSSPENSRQDWSGYKVNGGYRKLTPIECERLQTVPDNYTNHVSNTQRYQMLGNGWTVDVITHILTSRGRHDLLEGTWS